MSDKPKRRWYRFSLRDLMWLMVVAALTAGWWGSARRSEILFDRVVREWEQEKKKNADELAARERAWQNQRARVLGGQH